MTAMDNAVLQVHKTIQANHPKNVPIAEFLKTVIDSFPAELARIQQKRKPRPESWPEVFWLGKD